MPKKPEQVKSYTPRVRMTEEEHRLSGEAAKVKSLELFARARSELVALARSLIRKPQAPLGQS